MTNLLFISGSLRAASAATATARTLMDRVEDQAQSSLAEIGDLPHYNADIDPLPPGAERLKEEIEGADGLVIVTPEYNYSLPGVLKNALDWASRPAFASVFRHKPVMVISVSGGALGGVRAQAHLKYILQGMMAPVFPWPEIAVTHATSKIEQGRLADEESVGVAMKGLEAFVRTL